MTIFRWFTKPFRQGPFRGILAWVLVFGTIIFVAVTGANQRAQIDKESDARADQACQLFEQSHYNDVQQLKQTYAYLKQLSPEERKQPLNRFIIVRLPITEKQASKDTAPEFCDQPGLGRPEPDPVVPKRPANLGLGPDATNQPRPH